MRHFTHAFLPVSVFFLAACGGDSGGSGGSCAKISGTWAITGTCPDNGNCHIAQSGCTFTMVCDSGSTFTGTVTSSGLTLNQSDGTKCNGNVDLSNPTEPVSNGSCTSSAGTCTYDANCTSGTCLSANEPAGSGGAAGTGGSSSNSGGSTSTATGGFGGTGTGGSTLVGSGGTVTETGGAPATGGISGTGGTTGTTDPTCTTGVNAVCTCLQDSPNPCSTADAQNLYDGCVGKVAGDAFVACYAGFVSDGQIACGDASTACIQQTTPTTCDPATAANACSKCVETKCCAPYLACSDATCAGDGTNLGEFSCIQECILTNLGNAVAPDPEGCASQCAVSSSGVVASNTNDLVSCVLDTGSGTIENCATECFGAQL